MTVENKSAEALITKIVNKVKLEPELIGPSVELYKRAVNSSFIAMSRIKDMSIMLACVYIVMRQLSKKPVIQEALAWNFKTSTATIRKTYTIICRVLSLERKSISGRAANQRGYIE